MNFDGSFLDLMVFCFVLFLSGEGEGRYQQSGAQALWPVNNTRRFELPSKVLGAFLSGLPQQLC